MSRLWDWFVYYASIVAVTLLIVVVVCLAMSFWGSTSITLALVAIGVAFGIDSHLLVFTMTVFQMLASAGIAFFGFFLLSRFSPPPSPLFRW